MSRKASETVSYTFDQQDNAAGWAVTELPDQAPGVVYSTRQPLAGGDYEWRVARYQVYRYAAKGPIR